jgi:hypothetical protein
MMNYYDFRTERMKQIWMYIIPYVGIVLMYIWYFTWLKDMCADMTHHTGYDFNKHYELMRTGVIIFLISYILLFFIIGIFTLYIGVALMIVACYRIARDYESHLKAEGTYTGWITKGAVGLGAYMVWPLQIVLNNHWQQHGMASSTASGLPPLTFHA